MKRGVLVLAPVLACGAAFADAADPKSTYAGALDCAGRFKWLLDASSGGQPPVQEYSLADRVKAVTVLEGRAKELAPAAGADAAGVPAQMLKIADETTALFFDDPGQVEGMLAACAAAAGIR